MSVVVKQGRKRARPVPSNLSHKPLTSINIYLKMADMTKSRKSSNFEIPVMGKNPGCVNVIGFLVYGNPLHPQLPIKLKKTGERKFYNVVTLSNQLGLPLPKLAQPDITLELGRITQFSWSLPDKHIII